MTRFMGLLKGALAVTAMLAPLSMAQAQSFPTRPITFIYPYAAGSNADSAWRLIGEGVSKIVGQPVVHENRAGAAGRVGLEAVLKAQPDGYTLGVFNTSNGVLAPLMDPALALTAGKDYTPIQNSIQVDLILAAKASLPFRDMKGMIEFAKANPGKLVGASTGVNSGSHIGLVQLMKANGIEITHVPYGGTAPAVQAMLSGEVDLLFADITIKPYLDQGKLVVLGTAGTGPNPVFPGVKTMQEQGLAGFYNVSWNGVVGPPGIPAPVVKRITDAFNEALQNPELRKKLEGFGFTVKGGGPDELAAQVKQDLEYYKPAMSPAK